MAGLTRFPFNRRMAVREDAWDAMGATPTDAAHRAALFDVETVLHVWGDAEGCERTWVFNCEGSMACYTLEDLLCCATTWRDPWHAHAPQSRLTGTTVNAN